MADNVSITPGTGAVVATDDVAGVQFQRVKLDVGADGASAPVTAANPLPVALDAPSLAALESISVNNFPATQPVSLAAPIALDSTSLTALENITVQQSALPTGASTEATLAAASAKLPATLGAKAAAASLSVAPATDGVFSVLPTVATHVDRSGTITAGGTAQQIAAANATRRGFSIQNNSAGDLWFNTLAVAVQSQPSIKIVSGALYESPAYGCPGGAISLIGATTAQAFSAREW